MYEKTFIYMYIYMEVSNGVKSVNIEKKLITR